MLTTIVRFNIGNLPRRIDGESSGGTRSAESGMAEFRYRFREVKRNGNSCGEVSFLCFVSLDKQRNENKIS